MAIINLIKSFVCMTIMGIVLVIQHKRGLASRYTGCKLNGREMTFQDFLMQFGMRQEIALIDCDQGKLCVVHGVPGAYYRKGQVITEAQMTALVPSGHYTLCSCCNGTHRDFAVGGKTFDRDKNTLVEWETVLLPLTNGTLYVWGSKWVSVYTAVLRGDYSMAASIIAAE